MKIVFVVYHDLKIEARSQETLKALEKIGSVTVVTCAEPFSDQNAEIVVSAHKIPILRYLMFLMCAVRVIKSKNPQMVCLHDCSVLIPYILNRSHKINIVYDQSELLIDRKVNSIKSTLLKILDLCDKRYIKKCDVVFTANIERAEIMKDYYSLKEIPIVFDNIHRIEEEYNITDCQKKYGDYFKKNAFNIVSGGGLWKERRIYELMDAVIHAKGAYQLIIAGGAPEGLKMFEKIKEKDVYNSVSYLGFIPRNEWRYLLSRSEASFSSYEETNYNYIYCASGKTYESLFEGKPILTSENPPFKRLCKEYGVGVSNNDFSNGLHDLLQNYSYYKSNAERFSEQINYKNRESELAEKIGKKLKQIDGGMSE